MCKCTGNCVYKNKDSSGWIQTPLYVACAELPFQLFLSLKKCHNIDAFVADASLCLSSGELCEVRRVVPQRAEAISRQVLELSQKLTLCIFSQLYIEKRYC